MEEIFDIRPETDASTDLSTDLSKFLYSKTHVKMPKM